MTDEAQNQSHILVYFIALAKNDKKHTRQFDVSWEMLLMRRMRLVCIFVLFMIENTEIMPVAELLFVKICSFYQEARFKPHTMIQIIQTKGNS